MRNIGPRLRPIDTVLVAPDTVATAILTTAGAVVAQDWPDGATIMHINNSVRVYFNPVSTSATIPTTNSIGSTATANRNIQLGAGHQHYYYVNDSTGYSIAGESSGVATIEFWSGG